MDSGNLYQREKEETAGFKRIHAIVEKLC